MVKPITKETLFMNVMELDFPSKIELEHWLETFQDRIWTDDLMAELSKAGLIRVTVSQVWNKENHRLTRTFEYESEKAYRDCQKIIEENFEKIAPTYYRLLSEWMNSSYEVFNDIDKYRIILYLINKDFDHYIQIKEIESYDNFFMFDKSLELDRINIIEISKSLNIPKESTRRKILDLEKLNVLQKIGKKIYIDRSAYRLVQPKNTLKNESHIWP